MEKLHITETSHRAFVYWTFPNFHNHYQRQSSPTPHLLLSIPKQHLIGLRETHFSDKLNHYCCSCISDFNYGIGYLLRAFVFSLEVLIVLVVKDIIFRSWLLERLLHTTLNPAETVETTFL